MTNYPNKIAFLQKIKQNIENLLESFSKKLLRIQKVKNGEKISFTTFRGKRLVVLLRYFMVQHKKKNNDKFLNSIL